MSLPQIIATYNEMHRMLAKQESGKKKKKRSRAKIIWTGFRPPWCVRTSESVVF
jgi:hypothetical protein